jgi:GST-like protein
MGEPYTIADMAIFPWIRNLIGYYAAGELVRMGDFPHVLRAFQAFMARPAVIRGVEIP